MSCDADKKHFKWGIKRGVGKIRKDIHFYESFSYGGEEYFLFDCVYLYHTGDVETSIGKIVKMYETPMHENMVKVVWFLRPHDIRNHLGYIQPQWNEIFLASGKGCGLSNVNPVEALIGKCNVVCTSKDKRNPQASVAELNKSDYIFSRTFDVGKLVISNQFADEIDGFKVEFFFNKRKDLKISGLPHVGTNSEKMDAFQMKYVSRKERGNVDNEIHISTLRPKMIVDNKDSEVCLINDVAKRTSENSLPPRLSFPQKKRKLLQGMVTASETREPNGKTTVNQRSECTGERDFSDKDRKDSDTSGKITINQRNGPTGKEHFHDKDRNASDKPFQNSKNARGLVCVLEVKKRPGDEKRSWFRKAPWEERLQTAQKLGTLVFLQNLDPSFTSSEVEDLVWSAFNELVEAKMIQRSTFSSPHYGEAFVIFKSENAAQSAITNLNTRCLILNDGRRVISSRGSLREPGAVADFNIERGTDQKLHDNMKKAVSTSHYSQTNTVEYEMALQWKVQQHKSEAWWKNLFENQRKEIQDVTSRLKIKFTV